MEINRTPQFVFDLSTAGVLTCTWTPQAKKMSNAEFKVASLAFAKEVARRKIQLCLVDVRAHYPVTSEKLQKWRMREIVPRYHKGPVKKFAYVLPARAKLPPAAAAGEKEPGEKFLTGRFSDIPAALAWLETPAKARRV